jgi:hypothetical protein
MDDEPETLSLWSEMIAALKSYIKYGPSLKEIVSDINVTDIFIKRNGERDEDAITFWGQIITIKGVKNEVETLLSHTLKRRKERGIMVQQIPLSRSSEISKEFIEYVIEKIRNTPSLWKVGDVKFMKSKASTKSEIELTETIPTETIPAFPVTPGPIETTIATEPEHTRNYSQRQMSGSENILEPSHGTK